MSASTVFFGTVIFGLFGAVIPHAFAALTGLLSLNAASGISVAIILLCMAAYHFRANQLAKRGEDRAVLGDTCYYLGFIFTLGILAVSFLFSTSAGGIAISGITTQFALGLFATAYGLVARIQLTTFTTGESLEDSLAKQEQLAAKINGLSSAIENATGRVQDVFQKQSDHLVQTVSETKSNLNAEILTISQLAEEFSRRIASLSATFIPDAEAKALKVAMGSFAETMQQGREEADKSRSSMAKFSMVLHQTTSSAKEGIDGVAAAGSSLAGTVSNCADQVNQLRSNLASLKVASAAAVSQLSSGDLSDLHRTLAQLSSAVAYSAQKLTALGNEAASATTEASNSTLELKEFGSAVSLTSKKLSQVEITVTSAEASIDEFHRIERKMAKLADDASKKLGA